MLIKTDDALEDLWYGDGQLFEAWLDQQRMLAENPFYCALEYLWFAVKNTIKGIKQQSLIAFPNFSTLNNTIWTLRWAILKLFRKKW